MYFLTTEEIRLQSAPLAVRLLYYRERAGFTQDTLAQRSCVVQQEIHRIENRQRITATMETLIKLARALGLPLGVLAGVAQDACTAEEWSTLTRKEQRILTQVRNLNALSVESLLDFLSYLQIRQTTRRKGGGRAETQRGKRTPKAEPPAEGKAAAA